MAITVAEQVARIMLKTAGTEPVSLSTIYTAARKSWRHSKSSLESTIRAQMQRHSSNTAQYNGTDMFRLHRPGVWSLRATYAKKLRKSLAE